jgi:hypothetical protein
MYTYTNTTAPGQQMTCKRVMENLLNEGTSYESPCPFCKCLVREHSTNWSWTLVIASALGLIDLDLPVYRTKQD